MDPTACFERFIGAVVDGDHEEATAAINDLNDWNLRGGFPAKFPDVPIPARFVSGLVRAFETTSRPLS